MIRDVLIVLISALLGGVVGGCVIDQRPVPESRPVVESLPVPVPDPVPNLSPEEYAEMSGFDASTEQTLREQVRNNDLAWRVGKLEREVRRLNQRIYGVAELRIGDDGQSETPTEAE